MQRLLNHRNVMAWLTTISIAFYLLFFIDRGSIPHDEGLLGQSAERVVQGQWPHIDFDDPYTGGQAMLHAVAFKLFGVRSYSLRIVLYVFAVAFACVTYAVAARISPPWLASLLTWLSIAWSVPNYFAGLPSWYNLFLAMFGTYALIRYDETNRRTWLVIAGCLGGLSFLFKLSGLFFIAAGVLYLVYHEQERSRVENHSDDEQPTSKRFFTAFCAALLLCFMGLLVVFIRQRTTSMDVLLFVLPSIFLSIFLVSNEYRHGRGHSVERLKSLTLSVSCFVFGVAIPVSIFLIFYASQSGLDAFIQGVFILPQKRTQFADYPLPGLESLLAILPWILLLIIPYILKLFTDSVWWVAVALLIATVGILLGREQAIYAIVWNSVRPLVPVATLLGCVSLSNCRGEQDQASGPNRRVTFLLIAMAAMVSLVQYPYSFGIYFCYAAPMVALAVAAVVRTQPDSPLGLHFGVMVFYLGFAMVCLNSGAVQRIGVAYVPRNNTDPINLDRSGLIVSPSQAELYQRVIEEVMSHSRPGEAIYATTDCPEIYFLSGRKNPTRTFYEFFEADFQAAPQVRVERIASMLESSDINVIVLHWQGEFSGDLPTEIAGGLATRYPNVMHFVRDPINRPTDNPVFSVAWRDPEPKPLPKP